MEQYKKAAGILNCIANALNGRDHAQVKTLFKKFDDELKGHPLPLDFIYRRVWAEAELSARIGNYSKGIKIITSHLSLFEQNKILKLNLLRKAGKLECLSSRIGVSSRFLIEALGLAEEIGGGHLIAQTYEAISQMFSLRYPGLAVYFLRKAERLFEEMRLTKDLLMCRMERAFISVVIARTRNIPDDKRNRLILEAESIVAQYKESDLNPHEVRYCCYIKAFVNADEKGLLELIEELNGIEALPDKCRYEDAYIGFCVEKGLWNEARSMFERYKQDIVTLHGDSEEIQCNLRRQSHIIEEGTPAFYVPYHAVKGINDYTTLFDILDHYSLQDELWALDGSTMRMMFPSYSQEGKFDAVRMPDGTTRLYPMGLAFNVYYRGQSRHYEESYPTLYRNHMTKAKQFVERIKLEELRKCVDDYPITELFRNGLYISYPDGSSDKIELAVDVLALAQHYGICTELMDMTTDKFVAAFFATTNCIEGEYIPITKKQKNPGVFYRYSEAVPDYQTLSAVGLQPFSRPGEQSGLVYKMNEGQNFNDIVISSDYFEHDPEVSQFIFNYTNRSKKLFPPDPLTDHADRITKSKVFSTEAYCRAKDHFYNDTPDCILKSYLSEEKIELSDDVNFNFSDDEKKACIDVWNNGGQHRTISQIMVRLSYTGPIVFDD